MRSFETSELLCCGRNKESLRLSFGVSGRVLALGLGLGLGFGLVVPEAAQAACVSTPDCESLGYTETSCVSGGVKCPWDTSKLFCGCSEDFVYSCSGTGYSSGVGGACGGKYASCNCANGYDWNGSSCIDSCGVVGNILYSDKTCTSDKVSGKTPIGVVSYINGSTRIAIQLDNPGTMLWSSDYVDLSRITNYTDSSAALSDFSGKSNTQAWVNYYGTNESIRAPGYCYNYTTTGTSKGDWYLPAAGELYASVWTNKTAVNAGLSKAGGTAIVENSHWSSSESGRSSAWYVTARGGYVDWSSKKAGSYFRCVLAF